MNKRITICASLGLSQMEMAILLQISRAQWSMYESGKRDLPLNAKLLLSEILTYMQTPKVKTAIEKAFKKIQPKATLAALLKENEYQQLLTNRKITSIQKKYEANIKAKVLSEFLESQSKSKAEKMPEIHKLIASRATKGLEQNPQAQLTTLEIKLEVLQAEAEILQARLK